jgi:hypothetical protein
VDVQPVALVLCVQPAQMASTKQATLALVNHYNCLIANLLPSNISNITTNSNQTKTIMTSFAMYCDFTK